MPRTDGAHDEAIEAEREARGLRAAPRADRLTLLRRASLDLIGLPPSPEEIDAFERVWLDEVRPRAGRVLLDGSDVTGARPEERIIGSGPALRAVLDAVTGASTVSAATIAQSAGSISSRRS